VDILVNNAGSNPAGDLAATSDEIWRRAWDLKVFGYINLCRSICDAMKQRRDGVIANIIGYAGERLFSRYIIGATGNAALMAFSSSVGSQSPDFGVRVFGINPVTPRPIGPKACCARSPRPSSAPPSVGTTSSATWISRLGGWARRKRSQTSSRSWCRRAPLM
jgi:NAD(P)-dependent dehydrogenase (short-subunit alcohol dehydrogenase family)